ncbi:MAG: hypothetical protein WC365_06955 [Candidatus Babeliales bacterium]|jgi:hypothetical protein
MNKRIVFALSALLLFIQAIGARGINFGSRESKFYVEDNAALEIAPYEDMLEIKLGTLANNGYGILAGNHVYFNTGVYTFFNSVSDVVGTLEPTENLITLQQILPTYDGGTMIANPGGLAEVKTNINQGVNLIRGQPLFFGTDDVVLGNATSQLSIAIQNTLNTNIWLNGGILFLQDDLRLGDDAVIKDSGQVLFNNRRLSFGGVISVWNGDILWDNAADIQLNSAVTLNGIWTFRGDGQINGNGNVIDIASGGSIVVEKGSTLRLAGVHIKGLGADGTIKLLSDRSTTSTLILTDTVLEMDADYVFDAGHVFVEGNSTAITKDHILSFTENPVTHTRGKIIVDRVAFTYDTLATIDKLNVQPPLIKDPFRHHAEVIGNGEIRTIREDTVTYHNYRSAPTLLKYAVVAPYRKFEVFPEALDDGSRNYEVLLNGNTNFIGFTLTEEQVFIITNGVHATTTSLILRDFSPNNVLFQPGSSLIFGDQTMITLSRNESLSYRWTFSGQTIFRGGGCIFDLSNGGELVVTGSNSVLLLDSITLKGISRRNIRCMHPSARIILKDVQWLQSGDFEYEVGGLNIMNNVNFVGRVKPGTMGEDFEDYYSFIYTSTSLLQVLPRSTFSLTRYMPFVYNPADGKTRLVRLTDESATLFLDQATLQATEGAQLNIGQGYIMIREDNYALGDVNISDPRNIIDQPEGATLES